METVLWFVRMLCVDALTFAFVVRVVLSIFSAPGALSFFVVVVVVFPVLFTSSSSSSSIATFGFLEVFLSLFCVVVPSSVSLGGGCILSVVCVVVCVVSLLEHSLFSLRHHHHRLYPSSSSSASSSESSSESSTPASCVFSLKFFSKKCVYEVKKSKSKSKSVFGVFITILLRIFLSNHHHHHNDFSLAQRKSLRV